jgi:asparagine synthase (glutamine-hydrolysing)
MHPVRCRVAFGKEKHLDARGQTWSSQTDLNVPSSLRRVFKNLDMQINIDNDSGMGWHVEDDVYIKGYFYCGDKLLKESAAAKYFSDVESFSQFRDRVTNLNGSFAVVVIRGDELFAAVDRLRSIPLFYSSTEDFSISDTGREVYSCLSESKIDKRSREEFLLAGYSIGNSTLFEGISQLQAGQMLHFSKGVRHLSFYYDHQHRHYWSNREAKYFDDLDAIFDRVFERLVESCGGRPIAVPLSGGYDSRLIAAKLKMLDVKDVICFTYGREESFEVGISKRVAEKLGYEWHFVEYTSAKWRDCFEDSEFTEYASNLTSLPNVQDYIAIKQLTNRQILPNNAILVPGYCGDLLGGSYVPYELLIGKWKALKREGLTRYILRKHFGVDLCAGVETGILNRIANDLGNADFTDNVEQFVSGNEEFFTRHKVSKYVVNAVRSIEYFGYEWRMPFWDNELVEYFYRVPVSERLDDRVYDRYLLNNVFSNFGIEWKKPTENRFKRNFKAHCPKMFLGAAENTYQILVRSFSSKRKADFNAMSHFVRACATDIGMQQTHVDSGIVAVHAQWFIDRYLEDTIAKS